MSHNDTTVDQFTQQAAAFASADTMNDEAAMRLLLGGLELGPTDTVLDVACGPGIVAAAIAPTVRSVVGIDLTPQMIGLARERCAQAGLDNTRFDIGDVTELPYDDGEFSRVVCRYVLHHLADPSAVVGQMARVCAPGGRVVIADMIVGDDAAAADRFNEAERARDPSHVRSMPALALAGLMADVGLEPRQIGAYRLPMELDALLGRSASPDPDAVRAIYDRAIGGVDPLGIGERREDGHVRFEFPIVVLAGKRSRSETR